MKQFGLQPSQRRIDPEAVPQGGSDRERCPNSIFEIPLFVNAPKLLVQFRGIGPDVEIPETPGHIDAEFDFGVVPLASKIPIPRKGMLVATSGSKLRKCRFCFGVNS